MTKPKSHKAQIRKDKKMKIGRWKKRRGRVGVGVFVFVFPGSKGQVLVTPYMYS